MSEQEIGARLRGLRLSAGLSQLELSGEARAAGWASAYPQTILKVEKGTRALKLSEAAAVCAALGAEVSDLVDPASTHEYRVDADVEMRLRVGRDVEHIRSTLDALMAELDPNRKATR